MVGVHLYCSGPWDVAYPSRRKGVTDCGQDEIRPVHREDFADRNLFCELSVRVCHLFLKKGDDYTEYPSLERQDRVTGSLNSLEASEGAEENLTPGADSVADHLLEGPENHDHWDFDCA